MPELKDFTSGARIDDRPEAEKHRDYRFGEIVASANPVAWTEKPRASWRKFPIFNQNGSGSCVAQTIKKLAGVLYWLKYGVFILFSASDIYQRRSNKPAGGMWGVEAFNLWRDGLTLEEFAPSEGLTDAQMDALGIPEPARSVGKVFKLGNFVVLPIGDIETVASVIQTTKKAVMLWFWGTGSEWTDEPEKKDASVTLNTAPLRHSVAGVDFTMWKGEKAIVIDESWGLGATVDGQRVVRESFFKARNYFVAYPINFRFEDQTAVPDTKPRYNFQKKLKFIAWAKNGPADAMLNESQKADVKAMQDILKYEGQFPANVESTGYYGAITAKGVLGFQRKYGVASEDELTKLAGKVVGPKTRAKLNELYGI